MSEEEDFAAKCLRYIVTGFCVLVVSAFSSCSYNTTKRLDAMQEMVAKGASPLDAACAVGVTTDAGQSPNCILRASAH